MARKIQRNCRSEKNLEGLYDELAPGSNIITISLTTSTINDPEKLVVTERNSYIAKISTQLQRQSQLKVYGDCRGPKKSKQLVEEKIQCHVKEFTLRKEDEMKERDSGSRVSTSKSNIARDARFHP